MESENEKKCSTYIIRYGVIIREIQNHCEASKIASHCWNIGASYHLIFWRLRSNLKECLNESEGVLKKNW